MKRGEVVGVALVLGAALAGCGGRQGLLQPPDDPVADAGAPKATLGPVDFTQAPPSIDMTCDNNVGTLRFDNPCLVGFNIEGNASTAGTHVVECTLVAPTHPLAWSFLISLADVAAHPDTPLVFPNTTPTASPVPSPLEANGHLAVVGAVGATVTFSRVDPTNRAFIARLKGTFIWNELSGGTFSCTVDAPFWGAPGPFS